MTVGEIIRKYRKERGMTQDELADRLGVSAPAVNKWEKNNSLPDVALLAPIARTLGINTDTLLSFREDMTVREIRAFLDEIGKHLTDSGIEIAFRKCDDKAHEYPDCYPLLWQMSVVLDSYIVENGIENRKYSEKIMKWYETCLESEDERIRTGAAESAFYHLLKEDDTDSASEFLMHLSDQNPEKKRLRALLLEKKGEYDSALREYEEILLALSIVLGEAISGMKNIYMEKGETDMVMKLEDKLSDCAGLFELGKYQEISPYLERAVFEKDAKRTLEIINELIDNVGTLHAFTDSFLYRHIQKKTSANGDLTEMMREKLIEGFINDESLEFIRSEEGYKALLEKQRMVADE